MSRVIWQQCQVGRDANPESYPHHAHPHLTKHGREVWCHGWFPLFSVKRGGIQIRPARPPEPTGLGAVIEDAEGERWVRTYLRYGTGWTSGDEETGWTRYADIDVVRVLSEGVQP